MRILIGLAVSVLLLTGCSEEDTQRAVDRARDEVTSAAGEVDLPEVDWDEYGTKVKNRLDRLADQADCSALKRELGRVESNDSELTAYIKAKLRQADC